MVFNKWRKVNRIQMKGVTHSPKPGQRSNRNGSKPGRIENQRHCMVSTVKFETVQVAKFGDKARGL